MLTDTWIWKTKALYEYVTKERWVKFAYNLTSGISYIFITWLWSFNIILKVCNSISLIQTYISLRNPPYYNHQYHQNPKMALLVLFYKTVWKQTYFFFWNAVCSLNASKPSSTLLSAFTSLLHFLQMPSSITAGLALAQTAAETAWLQTFTTADLLNQTTIRAALFQVVAKSLSCYNFKKLLQQLCCSPEMLIMHGGDIIHF